MDSKELESIAQALDSQVEEIRHQAVRRLSELSEPVPLNWVSQALGDDSWRVRKAAVQIALQQSVSDELLKALAVALGDSANAGLRNSATEVLIHIGQPALGALSELLSSGDKDERKFVVDIMGEIGLTDACASLTAALDDSDDNVRGAAAEALGRIGDGAATPHLLAKLADDELLVQLSCLDALNRLQAQVPLPTLLPLLKVRPLRHLVFSLIGKLRQGDLTGEILPALIEGLGSRNRSERSAAARAITVQHGRAEQEVRVEIRVTVARMASDDLCQAMREMLSASDLQDREAAIAILGWTGRPEFAADLVRLASDELMRQAVAESLLAIGPRCAETLTEVLDDVGRSEKALIMEVLGHFGQTKSLPRIVEMALSDEPDVAEAAQRALGKLGNPSVLPTLVGLLQRGGEGLTHGAVGSLILLAERFHDEVLQAIEPLLSSTAQMPRRAASEVFSGMACKGDQPLLERLVDDQDSAVRLVAIRALGRVGDETVVDRLKMLLTDESPEVRAAVALALGNRSGKAARQALQVALRDEEPWVVAQALSGLGHSGDGEARQAVLPFCRHRSGAVALHAVRALNRLGWGDDQDVFSQAMTHSDPEVIKEILGGCQSWPLAAAKDALSKGLDDERWDVRLCAAKKIGTMRKLLGIELLHDRLGREEDQMVRETLERILRTD